MSKHLAFILTIVYVLYFVSFMLRHIHFFTLTPHIFLHAFFSRLRGLARLFVEVIIDMFAVESVIRSIGH